MAETIPDLRGVAKAKAYTELNGHARAVLRDIVDPIAGMATLAALVHHAFGHLWTGFYRVVEPGLLLRVGPYQGSLGCLEISFGRGVCGTAAAEMRAIIVPDVEKFGGHITCDARSRSEIVIPVIGPRGDLTSVFDIDSEKVGAFDQDDQRGLELLLSWFARPEQ